MDSWVVSYGIQYVGILIEAGLIVLVAQRSQRNRPISVLLYLSCLLASALARAYALRVYGLTSRQYFYIYWCTDFLLVISAFILVCLFFRRACLHEEKMWRFARLLLVFVFVVVLCISGLVFSRNYKDLFPYFVYEFNQNLYFACLVLNTLLYLLLQQIESTDDQLGLLVCGVGIQFAGPAATLALVHITSSERFALSLNSFSIPMCTIGMLLVWAYAILHVKEKAIQVARREIPVLAEVAAHLNIQI
jgi:multisubunit Na+/H+ antiporter MnhB subunit